MRSIVILIYFISLRALVLSLGQLVCRSSLSEINLVMLQCPKLSEQIIVLEYFRPQGVCKCPEEPPIPNQVAALYNRTLRPFIT
ncbi:hypothetical protein NPIL_577411 [Nephila pilipes]|uniref:Uncharacterized protein n=1 Tax=Nephila pilipes TaxID=299642 RepID=A0A8X6MB30_NEPPI|nr:hypothetical protein NPIL_577411 [Nephila pilipes]